MSSGAAVNANMIGGHNGGEKTINITVINGNNTNSGQPVQVGEVAGLTGNPKSHHAQSTRSSKVSNESTES